MFKFAYLEEKEVKGMKLQVYSNYKRNSKLCKWQLNEYYSCEN